MHHQTPLFAVALAVVCITHCAPQNERIPLTPVERQMLGLVEKFDRWDLNGDGRLTLDELDEASQISGYPAEEILKFYDLNGDGAITLREAQAAYSKRIDERP